MTRVGGGKKKWVSVNVNGFPGHVIYDPLSASFWLTCIYYLKNVVILLQLFPFFGFHLSIQVEPIDLPSLRTHLEGCSNRLLCCLWRWRPSPRHPIPQVIHFEIDSSSLSSSIYSTPAQDFRSMINVRVCVCVWLDFLLLAEVHCAESGSRRGRQTRERGRLWPTSIFSFYFFCFLFEEITPPPPFFPSCPAGALPRGDFFLYFHFSLHDSALNSAPLTWIPKTKLQHLFTFFFFVSIFENMEPMCFSSSSSFLPAFYF